MDKVNLVPGWRYLHHRQTIIDGVPREAERWLKFIELNDRGAVFARDFESEIVLTDDEISNELIDRRKF